jgi:hypothetical protein
MLTNLAQQQHFPQLQVLPLVQEQQLLHLLRLVKVVISIEIQALNRQQERVPELGQQVLVELEVQHLALLELALKGLQHY